MSKREFECGDSGFEDVGLTYLQLSNPDGVHTIPFYKCSNDPLLTQETSPSDFNKCEIFSLANIVETSPVKLFTDESLENFVPFMDSVSERILQCTPTSLNCSPMDLVQDVLCPEVFQDLRHTSTPKSQPSLNVSSARKRIKFTDGGENSKKSSNRSWHVLHDITDHNIMHSTDSFIKISDTFQKTLHSSQELDFSEEASHTPVIKKVPILRGNSRRLSERSNSDLEEVKFQASGCREFLFPCKSPSIRERDKWLYYTGFTDYELMMKVLAHISVPSEQGLSSFQILMLTMMRLKLDLEWHDLSYRFNVFVPTVFSIFHSTLSLLSHSLSELLPWNLAPSRISVKLFYLYPISFLSSDSGQMKHMYVLISNMRRPIVCIFDPVTTTNNPLSLIRLLSDYFIDGDEICLKGFGKKYPLTFFKISKTDKDEIITNYVECKNSVAKMKFVRAASEVLKSMKQYKLLLSKVPVKDEDMKKILTTVSALTNIKREKNICGVTLKRIYKKSCRAPVS